VPEGPSPRALRHGETAAPGVPWGCLHPTYGLNKRTWLIKVSELDVSRIHMDPVSSLAPPRENKCRWGGNALCGGTALPWVPVVTYTLTHASFRMLFSVPDRCGVWFRGGWAGDVSRSDGRLPPLLQRQQQARRLLGVHSGSGCVSPHWPCPP
jgi:hypothetical protein